MQFRITLVECGSMMIITAITMILTIFVSSTMIITIIMTIITIKTMACW